jgi:conjugation system TraG family ATPase
MEKELSELMPIHGMGDGCLLSRRGDYTLPYRITKPDIFTLSEQDFLALHQSIQKALRVLPANTILHWQDWFLTERYGADFGGERSFLAASSEQFFHERGHLRHEAFLFLTKKPKERQETTSALSNLIRGSLLPGEMLDQQVIKAFRAVASQAVRILNDTGLLRVDAMTEDEIWSNGERAGLLERYTSLSRASSPVLGDVAWGDGIRVGDQHCLLYTLADADDLPGSCGPFRYFPAYETDQTRYPVGFASALGPLLSCDHIYNQYIFIDDAGAVLKKLEAKRLRLQSLANYSRENAVSEEATGSFLTEALEHQRIPVRAHYNVLAWTDRAEELGELRNRVSSAIAQMDASPRLETVGAPQIWLGGMPGNEGEFPMNETFRTMGEQAACLLCQETNYRSSRSPFGIRLGDRLTGWPVHVDLDDEPKRLGLIANWNMTVLSGSGGGKSFFMNHLVRSYFDQGAHVVIVDIGHSYETLCSLIGGYYFTYREDRPLCFNPFHLAPGDVLDTEKRESIKTLLLALWKKTSEGV